MNSLNIVSRLTTTPPESPPKSRSDSTTAADLTGDESSDSVNSGAELNPAALSAKLGRVKRNDPQQTDGPEEYVDEKTALLGGDRSSEKAQSTGEHRRTWQLPRRVAEAVLYGVKVVFTTITAPGRYVIACFYDENGHFSAILPLKNLKNLMSRRKRKAAMQVAAASEQKVEEKPRPMKRSSNSHRRTLSQESVASNTSAGSTDGELDDSPARHTRSKTASVQGGEPPAPHKRSIQIKEHNEEVLRKRRSLKTKKATSPDDVAAVASTLKSPSSPAGSGMKLTKYPRAPAPPRPLVPRRQPSYTLSYSSDAPKKTLIIDLDETLIHSMAKGGRMASGHMVEVRLGGPVTSSGIQIGPGVPILYYVNERPGCHDFLRKVAKWYNLIAFTASVQEYADPVIDYLERERKYFSGRYYRQHCTYRNGAYIKDLAQVEPDMSKVMILDNSPMSYIFHEGMSHSLPPNFKSKAYILCHR